MKRFTLLLMAVLTLGVGSAVAQRYSVSGRVVDVDNTPIAYATVVVLEDDKQVAGGTTNGDGGFVVALNVGDYMLNINYIGYTSYSRMCRLHKI